MVKKIEFISMVFLICFTIVGCSTKSTVTGYESGTYTLITAKNKNGTDDLYKINTKTGDTWILVNMNKVFTWEIIGNPQDPLNILTSPTTNRKTLDEIFK